MASGEVTMKLLGLVIASFGLIRAADMQVKNAVQSAQSQMKTPWAPSDRRIGEMKIEVVKLRCEEDPYDACVVRGGAAVAESSENRAALMALLVKEKVAKAYVFGHDNHYGLFVLFANGTLAPYDKFTCTADHVICAGKCPCPVYGETVPAANPSTTGSHGSSSAASSGAATGSQGTSTGAACSTCPSSGNATGNGSMSTDTIPATTPAGEVKPVDNCGVEYVMPCDSSSSDCEKKRDKCKSYPKKCTKKCRARVSCHRGCSTKTHKKTVTVKNFVLDTRRFKRQGDTVVRACSKEEVSKSETFIMNRGGEVVPGNRPCPVEPVPRCLRRPRELMRLVRNVSRKFGCRPCLYINERCDVFVEVNGKFYRVARRDGSRRPHFRRIRGRKLRHLLKCGLYGVEFGSIRC